MSQLVETIKIQEGKIFRLELHNERLNRSRKILYPKLSSLDLSKYIVVPHSHKTRTYKCRVIYKEEIERIEYTSYAAPAINSLALVSGDHINYRLKWVERGILHQLYEQRGDADDIIIVRDGLLTDSLYCNIALKKNDLWYTPKAPILEGTQRSSLITNKTIVPTDILHTSINSYSHICLFNALNEWKTIILPTNKIKTLNF